MACTSKAHSHSHFFLIWKKNIHFFSAFFFVYFCLFFRCISQDNGFKMPSMQSTITLGTLPLRSLYAVLDSESYRVGLAQKPYAGELLPREGNEVHTRV